MIRKKIHYIVALFLLAGMSMGMGSCSKFLEKPPVSDLYGGTFWKSSKDVNVELIAMYFSFARAMSNGFYDWGEIRGGSWINHLHYGDAQRELISHQVPSTNTACRWTQLYQAIGRANLALKYIPGIVLPAAEKSSYLGEAYAMRALCYFYAVRTWGAVPVFTEPIEEYDASRVYPRRTNPEAILDLIESDLANAEQLLPASPIATPETTAADELQFRTRFTRAAVYAMMMDVYAWRQKYDRVIRVYEDKLAKLTSSATGWGLEPKLTATLTQADFTSIYRMMFDKRYINPAVTPQLPMSREVIFSIYYGESETGANQSRSYFYSTSQRLTPSDDFKASIHPLDKRFIACFDPGTTGGTGAEYRLRKYWIDAQSASDISENYLCMYRSADMVLLYAEALYKSDKLADAIAQMNMIRNRSGVPLATLANYAGNQEKLLDDILHERRMELICEGKYWFDLVRLGKAGTLGGCTNPENICLPIYRDHLLQNPNLALPPL